jgi:hypothetical protein
MWGETNNLASLSVIVHPPVSTSHGHIIFQCFQTIEKLAMPNEIIFTLQVLASPHLFSNVEQPITKISCVPLQSSQQNGANCERQKNTTHYMFIRSI